MNRLFGIDAECVQAIAHLSDNEVETLAELETKSSAEERSLISKVLSKLKKERWMDWSTEGIEVREWLQSNQEILFYTTANELKGLESFTEEDVDEVVWLVSSWLIQSMRSGLFKTLGSSSFKAKPVEVHRKLYPFVKEALMKRVCDRSWQERTVLENYLGGLEAKLMEAEVQQVLLS
jgi:hypothetical protein